MVVKDTAATISQIVASIAEFIVQLKCCSVFFSNKQYCTANKTHEPFFMSRELVLKRAETRIEYPYWFNNISIIFENCRIIDT